MGTTFNIKLKAESHLQPVKDVCTSPQDNLPLSSFQPSSAWLSGRNQKSDTPRHAEVDSDIYFQNSSLSGEDLTTPS